MRVSANAVFPRGKWPHSAALSIAAFWAFALPGLLGFAGARDSRADNIWRKADGFLCSCFCAARSYAIDEGRLLAASSSIRFGLSIHAIPVRADSGDLKFWLDEYPLHRLILTPPQSHGPYHPDSAPGSLGTLHELSRGVIVRAPPQLSFARRAQLLDRRTRGQYYHLVRLSEETGDSNAWRRRRALENAWFNQVGFDAHEGPDGGRRGIGRTESQPFFSLDPSRVHPAYSNAGISSALHATWDAQQSDDDNGDESVRYAAASGRPYLEENSEWRDWRAGETASDSLNSPDAAGLGKAWSLGDEDGPLLDSFIEQAHHHANPASSGKRNMREGSSNAKQLFLNQDTTRYHTIRQKQTVWNARCRKECFRVAKQSASSINFQPHNEFAFLKRPEDPYDRKSWISSEPLHVGDSYIREPLPDDASEEEKSEELQRGRWVKSNRQSFFKIFRAFRHPHSSFSMRRPTCTDLERELEAFASKRNGEDVRWSTLLHRFGVLRHPEQMAEPPHVYVPLREVGHQIVNVGVAYHARKPKADPPAIHKDRQSVPVDAALAIQQKLVTDKRYPVQWPVNTPSVVATPVSPQYWFTSGLERTPSGQYKLISHFFGRKVEGARSFVEFLGLYVDAEVAQVANQKIKEILENIWAPFLVQRYEREGITFGAKETTESVQGSASAALKHSAFVSRAPPPAVNEKGVDGDALLRNAPKQESASLSKSQSRIKQRRGSKIGSGNLDPGYVRRKSQKATVSEPSFYESYSTSSSDASTDKTDSDGPLKNSDSPVNAASANQRIIEFIDVEYVGEIHLGCWLNQEKEPRPELKELGDSPLLAMVSNNRLVFVIRGVSARLIRSDGLKLNTKLEGDPIAIEFFSPLNEGLDSIMADHHKQFREVMSDFRGSSYKLIGKTLLGMFSAETDRSFFFRNTCPLLPESPVNIPDHARSSSIVEKGLAAGDSPKTSVSPWIYKVVVHSQADSFQLYQNVEPGAEVPLQPTMGSPDSSATSILAQIPSKLLRDSLNEHLMKCYGRILPTAAIGASSSRPKQENRLIRRWECLDVPVKRRYDLVERVHPLAAISRRFA